MARGNPNIPPGPGRPKGVPNKVTQEIREAARKLLEGPRYLEARLRRLESGKLHPSVEVLLYHYAYGKPKEVVQVEGSESLAEILTAAMTRTGGSDGDSD